jgi:hypothetical protein
MNSDEQDKRPTAADYVGMRVTGDARDALRQLTIELISPAGRRVSMSDVILALVATADRDAVINALTGGDK